MSLLQVYLQNPRTRRVLSRKPSERGFSLIELVVVIAVLAVLTAIALPGFLGVTDDAAVRSAQQGLISHFKECQVLKARRDTGNSAPPELPSINDYDLGATTATDYSKGVNGTDPNHCFDANGAMQPLLAAPKTADKYPSFIITTAGSKTCQTGKVATGEKTHGIGCSVTLVKGVKPDTTKGTWE